MVTLRLPAEIETRLDALAKCTGRSKSFHARQAIFEYLDDLEDLYLASQRLEELHGEGGATVSLCELMKRYCVKG